MTPKVAPPWWQLPALLVASVGAIGTAAVVSARYIELPKKVEAAEQKNVLQDQAIIELKKSNEIWQEIYQQQQRQQPVASPSSASRASQAFQPPRETTWVEHEADGSCWRCIASTEEQCWEDDPKTPEVDNHWRRCPDDARTP